MRALVASTVARLSDHRIARIASTFALAVATVAVLHVAMTPSAQASTPSVCGHAMCNGPNCSGPTANHTCCYASGECETESCIIGSCELI